MSRTEGLSDWTKGIYHNRYVELEIPYLIIMPATLCFYKVILFLLGLVACSGSRSLSCLCVIYSFSYLSPSSFLFLLFSLPPLFSSSSSHFLFLFLSFPYLPSPIKMFLKSLRPKDGERTPTNSRWRRRFQVSIAARRCLRTIHKLYRQRKWHKLL
jgi:hypothetical protein